MRSIYVGFSRPQKFNIFSILIRLFEGRGFQLCEFSHVYIKFWSDTYKRWLIYQASGLVVNFESVQSFEAHAKTIRLFELEVADSDLIAAIQFCIDRLGKPYGLKQVLGIAWVYIQRRLFERVVPNPFADGELTEVCSSIAARLLAEPLKKDLGAVDFEVIGPRYLCDLIEYKLKAKEVTP